MSGKGDSNGSTGNLSAVHEYKLMLITYNHLSTILKQQLLCLLDWQKVLQHIRPLNSRQNKHADSLHFVFDAQHMRQFG